MISTISAFSKVRERSLERTGKAADDLKAGITTLIAKTEATIESLKIENGILTERVAILEANLKRAEATHQVALKALRDEWMSEVGRERKARERAERQRDLLNTFHLKRRPREPADVEEAVRDCASPLTYRMYVDMSIADLAEWDRERSQYLDL